MKVFVRIRSGVDMTGKRELPQIEINAEADSEQDAITAVGSLTTLFNRLLKSESPDEIATLAQ